MSVLFESPDYSQDFCEGCMQVVPGDHVCSPIRRRLAQKRYFHRNKMPVLPMIAKPVEGVDERFDRQGFDE